MKNKSIVLGCAVLLSLLGMQVCAQCPSGDLTGDCHVDLKDLAVFTIQWLTGSGVPPDIVYIPSGIFSMGDQYNEVGEGPIHSVKLSPFYIGRYEVTHNQYCSFLASAMLSGTISVIDGVVSGTGDNQVYCDTAASSPYSYIEAVPLVWPPEFRSKTKSGRSMANDSVVMVSWYGAAAYCNWRSEQEGKPPCYNLSTGACDFTKNGYHLPTEAQWEYAARGGRDVTRFPWGDTISHTQANYRSFWKSGAPEFSYDISPTEGFHPLWNDGVYPSTCPVGFFDGSLKNKADYNWPGSATSYQTTNGANGYGLYDMSGNVREWCNDWYLSDYYNISPQIDPTGPAIGNDYRVTRDGYWGGSVHLCRVSNHSSNTPSSRYYLIGFRLVLDFE